MSGVFIDADKISRAGSEISHKRERERDRAISAKRANVAGEECARRHRRRRRRVQQIPNRGKALRKEEPNRSSTIRIYRSYTYADFSGPSSPSSPLSFVSDALTG